MIRSEVASKKKIAVSTQNKKGLNTIQLVTRQRERIEHDLPTSTTCPNIHPKVEVVVLVLEILKFDT